MTSTTWPICPPRLSHGTELEVFVEIDCGAGRCGVTTTGCHRHRQGGRNSPNLKFTGIQAYQGAMQHLDSYEARKEKLDTAIAMVKDAVDGLKAEGIECELVSGGGTGSYYFESNSGVYNELQCGSYAFMDADYGRILDKDGNRIDQGEWENALLHPDQCHEPCQGRQGDRAMRASRRSRSTAACPSSTGVTMWNTSNARTSMG